MTQHHAPGVSYATHQAVTYTATLCAYPCPANPRSLYIRQLWLTRAMLQTCAMLQARNRSHKLMVSKASSHAAVPIKHIHKLHLAHMLKAPVWQQHMSCTEGLLLFIPNQTLTCQNTRTEH
jgi:hypothetical protein